MSIANLKKIFDSLSSCEAWSLQLLKIKTLKRDGTIYAGREITLAPRGKLNEFVNDISKRYTGSKGELNTFLNIMDYDGSAIAKTVYKLNTANELIKSEYDALITAIASPDSESDPLEYKSQAYLLKGIIEIDGKEYPVKLISMQNPVTTLNHKFWMHNGEFQEITDKVLSLKPTIDIVVFDECIYMMTLAGEKLFNMERAYRAVCNDKVDDIQKCSIVADFDAFKAVATSGHNPRKFVSFNDDHLQKLKKVQNRRKMAQKFNIPLVGDKFDVAQPNAADRLVKLLCDRGMLDPFDENPMEVAGSKRWV